jgi:thiamine biosynthesis protein ThiI
MPWASSDTRAVVVLRIGEIFLKGRNRRAFFAAFLRHARRLLADLPAVEVRGLHLRAAVLCPAEHQQTCVRRLRRLFGLVSMSPARRVEPSLEAITAEAIELSAAIPASASFKVVTRRRDKRFPLGSQEVSREVGARVIAAHGLRVRLHAPEYVLRIEIGSEGAYVFDRVIPGPGGLPAGISGRVAVLLSGGIDSPVAGWLAMRRGCAIEAIYFHSFPYTGDKTKEKVVELARRLARWQGHVRLHVVHFADVQKQLREAGRADLAVLLYRRMMMRAATLIARREGCTALVTGESIGQVASQTLANLAVIEDAAGLPVLRPLVTCDKDEIVARAHEIDTYDTSILPYDDCCALFLPKHPATQARPRDVAPAEAKLDLEALARGLAEGAELIPVTP